jgi:hypothetical protein
LSLLLTVSPDPVTAQVMNASREVVRDDIVPTLSCKRHS